MKSGAVYTELFSFVQGVLLTHLNIKIQNYNFACYFVWVLNLVADIEQDVV
jgi:hypothetical protein